MHKSKVSYDFITNDNSRFGKFLGRNTRSLSLDFTLNTRVGRKINVVIEMEPAVDRRFVL